uniref:Adhesion G protein-coupled receptor E8 n=1 Tax=Mola mola TaxID=94237 RepID=A0A3Q3W421_MOLML
MSCVGFKVCFFCCFFYYFCMLSDIDECVEEPTVCGPNSNCTNLIGSYNCTCVSGYRLNNPDVIASITNPCTGACSLIYFSLCDIHCTICMCACVCVYIFMLINKNKHTPKETESVASIHHPCFHPSIHSSIQPLLILGSQKIPEFGIVTCVYWEGDGKNDEGGQKRGAMQWSVEGCWISYSHENYTVCSCSHLSTFALILQIAEVRKHWLSETVMCVIVGLVFFALAIFTFLLCSWNPKINNTARLQLCLNLFLSHLLLVSKISLLHFLVIASFMWMLLEALQLHLLVRRLSRVQVIQRDGLPRPLLYLIGYGVPFSIVGTSALVYSDGYGATEANVKLFHLNLACLFFFKLNWILFCATLWSLRPTLANMKSDVSQSKDTRLILFKIVAQFFILGCTWILGLYQTNLFFQVLFIILNSQQGTFLFIVHCLLNKEVDKQLVFPLPCVLDAVSVSEDFDKPEKEPDEGKNGDG